MKQYSENDTDANFVFHFLGNFVQILSPRRLDNSDAGFTKWKFMSVATWGEDPRGRWTLEIFDEVRLRKIFSQTLRFIMQQHVVQKKSTIIYNFFIASNKI